MKPSSLFCILVVFVLAAYSFGPVRAAKKSVAPVDPPFPEWVFGHVVWEDESTTQGTYDLVKGYQERGIPVDAVIIDSPWETQYNTFVFDPALYPNAQKLMDDLHADDIKVILWITCMVNFEDPEYRSSLERGYFVPGREEVTWWKGTGGMIDYGNPEAMAWWHRRMDKAIELGLDGWKVDGTDPFMLFEGIKARRRYTDAYYSDFYNYTRERSGRKTVAMARPLDQLVNETLFGLPSSANPLGLGIYLKYAPQDVSFMSWVGDQDPTFDGLTIAIRIVMDSARKDYLIVGSDIGGYRGGGPDKEVLIRWAQFGAFCPLMENGGVGEHRPWMFDEETLDIYKFYTRFHKMLLPYLYSEAVEAWQEGRSMIEPQTKGRDHYLLGKDLLVAPIQRAGGKMKVVLPAGDDWWPLFSSTKLLADADKCRVPGSDPVLLAGGCSFTRTYDLSEYPVFVRAGALIPMSTEPGKELLRGIKVVEGHDRALMMIPPAPGNRVNVERVVYEEGREPFVFSGEIDTTVGVDHSIMGNKETWPVFTFP